MKKNGFLKVGLGLLAVILILTGVVLLPVEGEKLTDKLANFRTHYKIALSDSEKLGLALKKTADINSAYLDLDSEVNTRITSTKKGVSQNTKTILKGYISGSTDGKRSKTELRISNPLNPNVEVVVNSIQTEDVIYMKGPATKQKWWKMSNATFEKSNSESPMDASLFGFYLVGTLFEKNNAVLNSVDANNVQYIGRGTHKNKEVEKYSAEIAIPVFIDSLKQDDKSKTDVDSVKKILEDAVISATFYVDPETDYVVYLEVNAKNVKQIPTQLSKKMGLTASHDIKLTANLSRFNLENDISLPDDSEVIELPESEGGVLGVSIEKLKQY